MGINLQKHLQKYDHAEISGVSYADSSRDSQWRLIEILRCRDGRGWRAREVHRVEHFFPRYGFNGGVQS